MTEGMIGVGIGADILGILIASAMVFGIVTRFFRDAVYGVGAGAIAVGLFWYWLFTTALPTAYGA